MMKRMSKSMDEDDEFDEDEGEEEEGEPDEEGLKADELSDEEKALEEKLNQLQAAGAESEEDEGEEGEGEEEEDVDGQEAAMSDPEESLVARDRRLREQEEEVEQAEQAQLAERHWSLKGEVSGRQRPMCSLLELHVDQPMTHLAARRSTDTAAGLGDIAEEGDDGDGATPIVKGFDVEAIIRQRVWDETFDDVERKEEIAPSKRPQGADDDPMETLNFEKSRVGLADIYAKQYEAELLGHKTDEQVKEDKTKAETKALFAKLMYKLDQLTNSHFTPRPPLLSATGESMGKVPSIKMEETIPLTMSDASLKAPEEMSARLKHLRSHEELGVEEKAAVRNKKKTRRRRALQKKVESGQMSLSGMRERNKKLAEKNMKEKEDKKKIGQPKEVKPKRLRVTEMLEAASKTTAADVARKEKMRAERKAKEAGEERNSKRLKL